MLTAAGKNLKGYGKKADKLMNPTLSGRSAKQRKV